MGTFINNGNEVKSNLFSCTCSDEKNMCVSPKAYGEIKVGEISNYTYNHTNMNYFKTPEMQLTPDEYIRSFSSVDKNKNNSKNNIKKIIYPKLNLNFREENIDTFNKNKFESNPKILELLSLLGDNNNFILSEKESFYIKNKVSQNNLINKLLHYKDDCYYLGFIDKNNNNKELFGTYYYNDGSIYKGFFENDKIKGRGRLILINRFIYEGDFEDGLFNGFGKLYTINGIKYEGNWKNDIQDGFGVEKYLDGSYYSGIFKKGIKHGKGKFYYKNGDLYDGDFENDEMTGWGTLKKKDGKIYYGMFKNHLINGIGVFIWKDNKKYIGEYLNELKHGFGIFYTNDGRNYSGFWKEGKQNDVGVITNIYGQKYYIKYNNGEKCPGQLFSEKEKEDIDKLILEEEKRINKNKLNKIADDLIIQREKEKKVEIEKNDKNHEITEHKDIDVVNNNKNNNTNILDNNNSNKIKIYNSISQKDVKTYNDKKEGILINKDPSTFLNSVITDIGISFNNTQINKKIIINENQKNIQSTISKDGDKNTSQTSKIINNDKSYKNKSCPNMVNIFNNINLNIKEEKNKTEINNI